MRGLCLHGAWSGDITFTVTIIIYELLNSLDKGGISSSYNLCHGHDKPRLPTTPLFTLVLFENNPYSNKKSKDYCACISSLPLGKRGRQKAAPFLSVAEGGVLTTHAKVGDAARCSCVVTLS